MNVTDLLLLSTLVGLALKIWVAVRRRTKRLSQERRRRAALLLQQYRAEQRLRQLTYDGMHQLLEVARQVDAARWDPMSAPSAAAAASKRYATLLADPPWNIQQIGSAGPPYPVMAANEIAALRVSPFALPDAHLWLWVTNASLWAGKQVMESWGFTYRSILTWIKPRFGMGHYLRNQTEHLLLGTRGRAPALFRGQGSWFYAPVQSHRHKPEEQYAIIERMSPGPYLELFARRPRTGWHVWGNEVRSDVDLPSTGPAFDADI